LAAAESMLGTMRGLRTAILLALGALPATAWGNPCVLDYVTGRNVLAPAPQPDIFIAREDLKLELRARRGWVHQGNTRSREPMMEGSVVIAYEFDNRGAPRDLVIGFPIWLCSDGFCPPGDVISRFQVRGAGAGQLFPADDDAGLSLDRASLGRCEREKAEPADNILRRGAERQRQPPRVAWHLWRQVFRTGVNRVVVRYHVRVLSAEAGSDAALSITYILKTTAGWGDGKIGHLDVLFVQHGPGGRWEVLDGPNPPNVVHEPRRLEWRLESFTPERDLTLGFTPPGDED